MVATLALKSLVGKTIAAVESTTIEQQFGIHPMIVLNFTDGTQHAFIMERIDDTEYDEIQEEPEYPRHNH